MITAVKGANTPTKNVAVEKKTGGVIKAVASTFVPGLGQMLDGRTKAGVGFIGTLGLLAFGVFKNAKNILQNTHKALSMKSNKIKMPQTLIKSTKRSILGMIACLFSGAILHVANIVDAYKGKKV